MCARRARLFRNGGAPLIARLRQYVVPLQPPQLFSIRPSGSPQTPLKGGFHSKPQLRWIRVGFPNKQFAPRSLSGLLEVSSDGRSGSLKTPAALGDGGHPGK